MIRTLLALTPSGERLVGDVCQAHAAITALYPDLPSGAAGVGRILWAAPRPDRLLINGLDAPDLGYLPDGLVTGVVDQGPSRTAWPVGSMVEFAAVLNPVHVRRPVPVEGASRRSEITPIRGMDEIWSWAAERLHGLGSVTGWVAEAGVRRGRHQRGWTVTLRWARIVGRGVVEAPDLWGTVLSAGVGHGKAYGCGLVVCQEAAR